jgi:type I restriction enzyme S subunit
LSWPEVRLEELAVPDVPIVYGILKPGPNIPGGIPYVRPTEMNERGIHVSKILRTTPKIAFQFRRSTLRTGDLVLTIVGTIGKIALVPPELDGGNITQCSVRIRPEPCKVDTRYLSWALACPRVRQQYDEYRFGSGVPRLNVAHVRALKIPLPPLSEQRRIGHILEKADAIRRERKEAIALTDDLLRSTFLDMFGDPISNPRGWKVVQLGEILARFEAGWSANGEGRTRHPDEYGVLKISAVTSGAFRPEEHKAVPANAVGRSLVTPRMGDLLFSRANTRELVAATCLVEEDHPQLFLPDKLWRLTPNPSLATSAFLRFLLSYQPFRAELTKTATGTSGSMLNISMEKLRALRVPVPPLPLQRKFETVVWATFAVRRLHAQGLVEGEKLFGSLVHRAFRGSPS